MKLNQDDTKKLLEILYKGLEIIKVAKQYKFKNRNSWLLCRYRL